MSECSNHLKLIAPVTDACTHSLDCNTGVEENVAVSKIKLPPPTSSRPNQSRKRPNQPHKEVQRSHIIEEAWSKRAIKPLFQCFSNRAIRTSPCLSALSCPASVLYPDLPSLTNLLCLLVCLPNVFESYQILRCSSTNVMVPEGSHVPRPRLTTP